MSQVNKMFVTGSCERWVILTKLLSLVVPEATKRKSSDAASGENYDNEMRYIDTTMGGVSNHWRLNCLFNRLFRLTPPPPPHQKKKIIMLGTHWSPVNTPNKGQWCEALMFSLIYYWTNSWVNNREGGDLRRHHAHYDVTVMNIDSRPPWRIEADSRFMPGFQPLYAFTSCRHCNVPWITLILYLLTQYLSDVANAQTSV